MDLDAIDSFDWLKALAWVLILIAIVVILCPSKASAAPSPRWGTIPLSEVQAKTVRVIREVWRAQGAVVVRQALRVSSPHAPLVVMPTASSSAKISGISSIRSQCI